MVVVPDEEGVSYFAVQLRVAVLEVVEEAQHGAVVVVGRQRAQADVGQRHSLALVRGLQGLHLQLQVQHLDPCDAGGGGPGRKRK